MKKEGGIGIVITIRQGITIQGLYCYLDMGNNTTAMYYKCSHDPNLLRALRAFISFHSNSIATDLLRYFTVFS